jgi:hypothetical protein
MTISPLKRLIGNKNKGVAIRMTPRKKMTIGFLNMLQNY